MNEKEELALLRDMFENIPGGAFTYEADGDQRFIYVSPSLVELLGYKDEQAFLEATSNSFIGFVHPKDFLKIQKEIDEQIAEGESDFCEYRVRKADGTYIWMLDRGKIRIRPDGTRYFYVVVLDENTIMHKRMETAKKAKEDSLTGLLNHQTVVIEIGQLIQATKNGACVMVDIDNFKQINDTYGHLEGDRALCCLSKALSSNFPDSILGRFGGDEFILYFADVEDEEQATVIAEKILKTINKVMIDDKVPLNGSVGIALSKEEEGFPSVDRAIKEADGAMYIAKRTGKNKYIIK